MSKANKKTYRDPAALSIYIGAKISVPLPSETRHGGNRARSAVGTVEYIHPRGLYCTVRYQLPDQRESLTTTLPLRPVTGRDNKGRPVSYLYPRNSQPNGRISASAARYTPPTPFGLDVVTSNR